MTQSPLPSSNTALRVLAATLCCATFPLIFVGGLVTTTDAGMAVPDWPDTYGYNLFLYPWQTWLYGPWDLLVEHGHRLLGALAGLLTIAILFVACRAGKKSRLPLAAAGLLALVIVQGALGGARVLFDHRVFALIHACTGPVFFLATVLFWDLLSKLDQVNTSNSKSVTRQNRAPMQFLAYSATLLTFGFWFQLALGAFLRHGFWLSPQSFRIIAIFHVFGALVITLFCLGMSWWVWRNAVNEKSFTLPMWLLQIGVMAQVALGIATWLLNYGWPWGAEALLAVLPPEWIPSLLTARDLRQVLITTAHVAVGSLLLATSGLLAFRAWRGCERTAAVAASLVWIGSRAA